VNFTYDTDFVNKKHPENFKILCSQIGMVTNQIILTYFAVTSVKNHKFGIQFKKKKRN